MGRALKPVALVVENDEDQRVLMSILLEECDLHVVECESAEEAVSELDRLPGPLAMVFTDVDLAGDMSGAELAAIVSERFPDARVLVTSGGDSPELPARTVYMRKPWRALEVLCQAEKARH